MKLLVCAAAAVIAIGAAGWWYAPEYRGRQQVKAGLIDPDSAQFSNVTVNRDTWVVCGLVNARNRMGGYVGKTMFVAFLNDGDLRLEPPEETIGSTEDKLAAAQKRLAFFTVADSNCVKR